MPKLETKKWIASLSSNVIPRNLFKITFCKSSGPGGQNVNKVNTKTTIRLSPQNMTWIPMEAQNYIKKNPIYSTKSGEILISSDRYRCQKQNLDDCFNKFYNYLKKTVLIPDDPNVETIVKWNKIKKKTNEQRLKKKKFNSDKKKHRKLSD